MEEFRVPKREVVARIRLADGEEMDCTLYTTSTGPSGEPGRILDRLNDGSEKFVPLAAGSKRLLLNKRSLVWLRLPASSEPLPDGPGMLERRVRLALSDGQSLEGRLRYEMPPGRQRLIDFLNGSPPFIAVEVSSEETAILHRQYLSRVVDLGSSDDDS
jgi:hypothetical protein